jgi:hypothetical protein
LPRRHQGTKDSPGLFNRKGRKGENRNERKEIHLIKNGIEDYKLPFAPFAVKV